MRGQQLVQQVLHLGGQLGPVLRIALQQQGHQEVLLLCLLAQLAQLLFLSPQGLLLLAAAGLELFHLR